VVFHSPKNPDIEYIKRIIGLPGDTILVKNGDVFVNNRLLNEDYIAARTALWEGGFLKDSEPIVVPPESLFVMGDNRPRSSDSREFGPIPISSVIGQVFYRYFPVNKMGPIQNPYAKQYQTLLPRGYFLSPSLLNAA
jgi:signal peptidase I